MYRGESRGSVGALQEAASEDDEDKDGHHEEGGEGRTDPAAPDAAQLMRPQPSSACPPAQAAPATSGACPPWPPAPAAPRSFTSVACRSSYTTSSFVVRVTTRLGLGAAPPLDLHATAGSRPSPMCT